MFWKGLSPFKGYIVYQHGKFSQDIDFRDDAENHNLVFI